MKSQPTLKKYRGSCHCGAVGFEIESDMPELTTCDCSICRRKNALMVKVHESKFRLLSGDAALRLYQFHTFTAKRLPFTSTGSDRSTSGTPSVVASSAAP